MTLGRITPPEDDVIGLATRDKNGVVTSVINTWQSYSFSTHFLTPTDGWSFTLGDEVTKQSIIEGLFVGQRVSLVINGHAMCDGYIDNIKIRRSRGSGTTVTIEGRDRLAPVVDGNLDPQKVKFAPGQTLLDVLVGVFSQYGWTDPDTQYLTNNDINVNAITGASFGTPTSKKGKPLKSFTMHQLKPYPNEGSFAFAARVAHRHGLWIWLTAEGNSLVIGTPTFDRPATHYILHKTGAAGITNNAIDAEVSRHGGDQPTVIVCTGHGGGGEYGRSGLKTMHINELTGYDSKGAPRPEVIAVLNDNKDAVTVGFNRTLYNIGILKQVQNDLTKSQHRPLFLHDDESKTLDELTAFSRKEMSLYQRRAITATYVVEGHENNGYPWCLDTTVDVDDDVAGLHTKMWVMGLTFEKSRSSGTTTRVELILPETLKFS